MQHIVVIFLHLLSSLCRLLRRGMAKALVAVDFLMLFESPIAA
jgi:hypothetical protein